MLHRPDPRDSRVALMALGTHISPSADIERTLNRYRGTVRQAAYGHGITDGDLDELVQEVRIRLWKAHERGEKMDELPASYFYKTSMTASVDMLRRRRTAPRCTAPAPNECRRTQSVPRIRS